MSTRDSAPIYVYIGTYTRSMPHVEAKAKGIYVCQQNPVTGELSPVDSVPAGENPSYLTLDPTGRYLYSVNEVIELNGKPGGGVSAFRIDPATGRPVFLNRQASRGDDPCYLALDRSGRNVLVANYTSGSVALLPIRSDGSLDPASCAIQHAGASVNPVRQQGPHAHSINVDPENRFAVVADLGIDELLVYRMDLAAGQLVLTENPPYRSAPGAGPRHLDFHPNGRLAFLLTEIGSTLTSFVYGPITGTFAEITTLSTLPAGFAEVNHTADVHVHPAGRFVYASNRGHDSIAIFGVDPATGALSALGYQSTAGRTPRNFAIDPTGTFLYAANQDTDTVVCFRIDQATGRLAPTGHVLATPTPVCVKFRVPSA